MTHRSIAAAQALLAYRGGTDGMEMPARDLCRRLLNALGSFAALDADPDPHLVATALELSAERDPAVRIILRELERLVAPRPAGQGADRSAGTHVTSTGDNAMIIIPGRDFINLGSIVHGQDASAAQRDADPPPQTFTVLFAAASPDDQDHLRIDRELRAMQDALARSGMRDQIRLETRMAVRPLEFTHALLAARPRVVHFAGHGSESQGALMFEDEQGCSFEATSEALRALFAAMDRLVECVILNACYSRQNAEAILSAVPYVIGMDGPLHDDAAITYSTGFYQALGEGRSIPRAHEWGIALTKLMRTGGESPRLDAAPGAAG